MGGVRGGLGCLEEKILKLNQSNSVPMSEQSTFGCPVLPSSVFLETKLAVKCPNPTDAIAVGFCLRGTMRGVWGRLKYLSG